MKFFIITDLEGAALVARFTQTRDFKDNPQAKYEAMRLLTGEVNAAVDGILDAVPDADVIVWDGHGNGGINLLEFTARAKLINNGAVDFKQIFSDRCRALFFLGQHAMEGTPKATLAHTYSSRTVAYYKLNGCLIGEFGMRTFLAGAYGVPTVFISGDDLAVAEAQALVPKIHAAVVKWCLGLESAVHLGHGAACAVIRKTAADAAADIDRIAPVVAKPPYILEIRVKPEARIGGYLEKGAKMLDKQTVVFETSDLSALPI